MGNWCARSSMKMILLRETKRESRHRLQFIIIILWIMDARACSVALAVVADDDDDDGGQVLSH